MDAPSVETKSTGELIDALITTSIKMFGMQDAIMVAPDAEAGAMAKKLQSLNAKRNDLMRAISKRVDGVDNGTDKTYK